MSDIAQPHDRFLRALLSDPERAGTLLRERLPKEIAQCLTEEPPELVDGTFVDEALRNHLTDRLYRVRTVSGREALLYVLVEHKSQQDRKIGWQLLKYTVEALKQWERENTGWDQLPAIIPFVFYHGEAEWRIPGEFMALVDAEEGWRPWLLDFRFTVMDLGKIPDALLSRQPRLRAWLLAAKYATRESEQGPIREVFIQALLETPEDFSLIMRYVVETFQTYDEQVVRQIIRRVRPEEETRMMSQFAQEIIARNKPEWLREGRQEGRQEGLREGELKGLREGEMRTLLRQIQRRFGPAPDWVHARLARADLETLEAWTEKILDANSIDDIFQ